ncbi:Hypothetical predicted protein [Paramuricea clavata]|uniref:Uncharacterized protein n=1 Tax=Paramuricea clavata TaxID=317549 RepID=A0A7D9HFN4_PARCT|nr:Hypothetical predicted protein [Paramuricea clavata]
MAKVMEGITCTRLLKDLKGKIDPRQYARKGHSTTDALLYMMQTIHEALDGGEAGARIFFADFSKGFDLIDHSILIQELYKLQVHPALLSWISACLFNRRQAVRIGSVLSQWQTLKGGIPQGTKLGVKQGLVESKFDEFLCQTVLRKALKSSPNESTNDLWRATSNHTNIQYNAYNFTKEVLKDFRSGHENKLLNQLTSQGSFFCSVTKFAFPQLSKVWSVAQSKLPKNIYNFTIRYINNSLPTCKNLNRWAISSNSDCSFCLSPETLLHIVAGCQFYLDRLTWRHNSVLNFLAHQLQTVDGSTLYADLNGFKSPSILTGDTYRPDLLLSCSNGSLYVVELTTGYETNLKNNVKRKKDKYRELLRQLESKTDYSAKFANCTKNPVNLIHRCHSHPCKPQQRYRFTHIDAVRPATYLAYKQCLPGSVALKNNTSTNQITLINNKVKFVNLTSDISCKANDGKKAEPQLCPQHYNAKYTKPYNCNAKYHSKNWEATRINARLKPA